MGKRRSKTPRAENRRKKGGNRLESNWRVDVAIFRFERGKLAAAVAMRERSESRRALGDGIEQAVPKKRKRKAKEKKYSVV